MFYKKSDKRNKWLLGGIIILTWVALMQVSCTGNEDAGPGGVNNALNKGKDALSMASDSDIRKNEVLWYKDGHAPDYGYSRDIIDRDQPIPEALYFMPKDAEEGAKCLKWKELILNQYTVPGWEGTCWAPMDHWCLETGKAGAYACSPDGNLCCNFGMFCIPCGWTKQPTDGSDYYTQPESDPEKCKELRKLMRFGRWMVCQDWE